MQYLQNIFHNNNKPFRNTGSVDSSRDVDSTNDRILLTFIFLLQVVVRYTYFNLITLNKTRVEMGE